MCPKTMAQLYTWCEVIRCGGDFTYRGLKEKYEMDIPCADGCIKFHLKAMPINRMRTENQCQINQDRNKKECLWGMKFVVRMSCAI